MLSSTAGRGGGGGDGEPGGVGGGTNTTTSVSPSASSSFSSFWCHECEASVDILAPSISLVCPRCQGSFLEEIQRNPSSSPDPALTTSDHRSHRHRFHRLRRSHYSRNLASSDVIRDPNEATPRFFDLPLFSNRNYDDPIDHIRRLPDDDVYLSGRRGPSPAPKSSIDAIATVEITAAFLNEDPHLLCAVCKDEFVVGIGAKRLPCSHIYHSGCIVPWLMQHNTCPVCRHQLPTDVEGGDGERSRLGSLRRIRRFRVVEALNDFELRQMLTELEFRNEMGMAHPWLSSSAGVSTVSPSQMTEAEVGSVGPANGVESVVSSVRHRDGGTGIAGAASTRRVDEDTDAVSMDRRSTLE